MIALAFGVALSAGGCSKGGGDEVWIIGLDGADWDVITPFIEAGDLPNLKALRDGGASGVLRSDEPMLSPILWTSIATGHTSDEHGVTWFMSDGPNGTKIPVSSNARRTHALWDILSERDRTVGVIGWWATWPADPVDGFIVSDYVGWHSFGVTGRALNAPGKTYPEDLYADIRGFVDNAAHDTEPALARMVHLPPEKLRGNPPDSPIEYLREAIAATSGYTSIALHQLEKERPDLLAIYYEGTDATMHLYGRYAPPQDAWISDEDFAAYKDVVREYWKWQDHQLGRLLAQRHDNTTVVVVSDHGFRTGAERLKEDQFSIERADASHMIDGIIILNGPAVRAGSKIENASVYDVTPTVLNLMGLPVGRDMKGRPLTAPLKRSWSENHPAQMIATYETKPRTRAGTPVASGSAEAKQMEERLRSLGYISSGPTGTVPGAGTTAQPPTGTGTAPPGGTTTPPPATTTTPPPEASGNIEQAVNRAVVLRKQGKLEEAAGVLEPLLEGGKAHEAVGANLARVYVEMKRYDDAEKLLRSLIAQYPDKLANYEDLGLTLATAGRYDDAIAVYDRGLEQNPQWAVGLAAKAQAMYSEGKEGQALPVVKEALRIDPSLATAHYTHGAILSAMGRPADARVALERAMQLDPSSVDAALELSRVYVQLGDTQRALQLVEAMKRYDPDRPELLAQIGSLYLKAGRLNDALPILERAASELDTPEVLGNYGMALAATRDYAGAVKAFERVVELAPNSVEATATLGQLYMQMKQPDKAQKLLERAVAKAPDNARIHASLGMLYQSTGRFEDAESEYKRAIELDASQGVYHYQLGSLYAQQGDNAKAQAELEKAKQLGGVPGQQR